ncbi:MAG: methyltransferase type 11 [Deltaproteobacteria bacterium CG11_big_fil_rev_8_21_14_0_20_49_13]|nr:MAG: methyltransferase type 11 [Deltaproteobacteria bacterium CG11_big_fil_rev_8_21_14_0_20_49_13]
MENLEKKFDRTSRFYNLIDWPFERFRYRRIRKRIWEGLSGKILDAGVGTGCNMPFYPMDAAVVGIDLSAGMLERAKKKASLYDGKNVEFKKASVYQLPFPDESFDFIVATFLCCVVDQPAVAAHELRRVCKRGGKILFLEYVLSKKPIRRLIQKMVTPYTRFMFGVDFTQDTLATLQEAGFRILNEEDITGDVLKLIVAQT